MFIDVKQAHLNAKLAEDEYVYVTLPKEANAKLKCGRLLRWLYGMRNAASSWEREYSEKLQSEGYVRGKAAPTTFYNKEKDARCVVHGDDFTFLAEEAELRRMATLMAEWYEIKVRAILGPDAKDDKETENSKPAAEEKKSTHLYDHAHVETRRPTSRNRKTVIIAGSAPLDKEGDDKRLTIHASDLKSHGNVVNCVEINQ